MVALAAVLLVPLYLAADEFETGDATNQERTAVVAAPGGGEMIFAGREFHYVARARVDGQGQMSMQCTAADAHDHPTAAEER